MIYIYTCLNIVITLSWYSTSVILTFDGPVHLPVCKKEKDDIFSFSVISTLFCFHLTSSVISKTDISVSANAMCK